ncbi:hypothetical protein QAD02_014169 [Eretmocerus hayati]|uniref:Uncharacterized protein n=1 Tax=Eretmocerus hayati TaxID=131215 RepID=A0ACC2P4R0_9HYME|nr:hypothetical protein QAD02_014169 [Eretmocerus hayati]
MKYGKESWVTNINERAILNQEQLLIIIEDAAPSQKLVVSIHEEAAPTHELIVTNHEKAALTQEPVVTTHKKGNQKRVVNIKKQIKNGAHEVDVGTQTGQLNAEKQFEEIMNSPKKTGAASVKTNPSSQFTSLLSDDEESDEGGTSCQCSQHWANEAFDTE